MEKRYLSWKEAKEYTSMGDVELITLLRANNICVYQYTTGGKRFIDKNDIDEAFSKGKKKNNYFKNNYLYYNKL